MGGHTFSKGGLCWVPLDAMVDSSPVESGLGEVNSLYIEVK